MPFTLLGINNRNLKNFTTSLDVALELASLVPARDQVVAESGLKSAADLQRCCAAGVRRFLIGETLVRSPDPAATVRALLTPDPKATAP